ncbi:DNRLRE domain-containing protein [Brevibacillus porteri]|uniref:DNRLRE domain-containing protein n=1 Tax=Brevibacillus porteri TaxID=2126350 RepID=UPI00370B61FB
MPTITLDYTNGLAYDGGVTSASPGSNNAATSTLTFGVVGGGQINRAYLMFDLGLVPRGAVISSAILTLTRNVSGGTGGMTNYDVVAVGERWADDVTYNTQPTLSNVKYTYITDYNAGTLTIEVKDLVQKWINLEIPNYGFMMKNTNETISSYFTFCSKENGTTTYRPRLTITYSMPSLRSDAYFASGSTKAISGTNEFSLLLPVGTEVDDYLFATVRNNISAESIVEQTGWTKVFDISLPAGRFGSFYKKVTQTDILTGNAIFRSVSGASWYGSLAAYRNVKSVEAPSYKSYPTGSRLLHPGDVTPTKSGSLLLNINSCSIQAYESTSPFAFNTDHRLDVPGSLQTYKTKTLYTKDVVKDVQMRTDYTSEIMGTSVAVVLVPNANEPPTPPTNVRVDKTEYYVGDPLKIDFTPGTDTDGTISGYVIGQYYPDQGQWGDRPKLTGSPPFTVTCGAMTDTTTSKIRVASVDDKGAMSAWSESPPFSVKQKNGQIKVPTVVTGISHYTHSSSPVLRFKNGWIGQVLRTSVGTEAHLFVSKDGGKNWENIAWFAGLFHKGYSIIANENRLYMMMAYTTTSIYAVSIDVSTYIPGTNITDYKKVADTVDVNSVSLAFNKVKNRLSYVYSAKTSNYLVSFNLYRGEITILPDGDIGSFVNAKQLVANVVDSINATQVQHDVSPFGDEECVVYKSTNGTASSVGIFSGNTETNVWRARPYQLPSPSGNMSVVNPSVRYAPNGTTNLLAGAYIGGSGALKALYTRSTDGGASWSNAVDLGVCVDVGMAVDKNNVVYAYISNGGSMFLTKSSDGFNTFTPAVILTSEVNKTFQNGISVFREPSLETSVTIPPVAFRITRGGSDYNAFLGTWQVAEPPTVTLASPLDNIELTEGQTYTVSGSVVSKSAGAVIIVNVVFTGGTKPITSYISDGSTPHSFSKTYTYKNKQLFDGNTPVSGILPEGVNLRCIVIPKDESTSLSGVAEVRNFTVKYNMPPVISGTNQDLGAVMQIPSVNYSATDPEGNTFTFSEYLNGKQIRSFAGVAGQQYTVEISHDAWIRLDLNVQHKIKIVATDSAGISSERIYTFTRTETHIEFLLEYGNPDIKADFTLDGMPLRVLVTLERYLPEGSSIESVKVCNNYLDDVPTWEDCTNAVKVNRGYLFTNKNKTAPEWAINLWVTIDKGTAKERVLVNGYGGAFD